MRLIKLLLPGFLLTLLVVSCGTPPSSNQGGGNQETNIEIQITGTESIELGIETISQPNCTGTAEVGNTIEKSRTIEYVMEVLNGASVNANGQVGFAGTDIELGATVASQFGQSYGTSETLTRSITVKAKPGTNMQHIVRQVEIWKIGDAKVSVGGQQTIIPFKFRSDFAIELVNSQNIYPNGCDSLSVATASQPEQSGVNCSFITELVSKADVIQNLYEGQSLAGVQVRLISPVDVPAGWTVQYDGNDYLGPVHFDSGIVASFWSPISCRPISIGNSISPPISPSSTSTLISVDASCFDWEACWSIDDSSKTMTWLGATNADIGLRGIPLTKLQSGYTAIFTISVSMTIEICKGTLDGIQVGSDCNPQFLTIEPGIHRVTSPGDQGGFRAYPK